MAKKVTIKMTFGRLRIAFAMAIVAVASLQASEFYLKPGASDGNGTKDSPFGSFAAAQRAVRMAVADTSAPSGAVTVTVLDGSYFIDKPVRFARHDSGTALHPVVWRAQTRGGVRLTGGVPVPKLEKLSSGDPNWSRVTAEARSRVRVADLKASGISDYGVVKASGVGGPYMELVWNGRFQTLARWPNDGWTGIAHGVVCKTNVVESFQYADDRISSWTAEPAPYGNGFFAYNWAASRVAFESIDPTTKTIRQKGRGSVYGYSKIGFWYGYNLLCELDAPGEYYIDRERGRLYFYPPSMQDGAAPLDCELTATDELFGLANASKLEFEGFRIESFRDRGVSMSGCSGIRFADCSFANIGAVAVTAWHCRDCRIAGCDIAWCGSGGVSMEGGDAQTLSHGNLVVENCHIHHFALISLAYAPAVKAWGCGNAVRNCTIHDGPHVAIFFGGRENEFLRNEIHSVCLESGETGAIYTGRDWTYCGNRIEANYIHDIKSLRSQPNRAIMLDDGCAGMTIASNRFVNVTEGVSLSGIGNVVENNLFISNFPPVCVWQDWSKPEDWKNPNHTDPTLLRRFDEVPVHEEPWKSKYPYLAMIDDAIKTGRLRHPDTRSILRRNISSCGFTNFVSYTRDIYRPRPETWIVDGNTVDGSAPTGFASLPPLSEIGAWRPLFADDLSDAVYDPEVWSKDADGCLTATKDVAIWTRDDYSRFELSCEYNLEPAANSGILIYCSNTKNWIPNAVEIQLLDNGAPKWKGLDPRQANLSFFGHQAPKSNPAKPAGEWNSITVRADGKKVSVTLNGVLVNECDLSVWTDAKKLPDGSSIPSWLSRPWADLATSGKIGLQGRHAGAGVRFRNVRIRPL